MNSRFCTLIYALIEQLKDEVLEGKGGEVITVCGAGGNRDKGKRPLMAQEAVKQSDKVIITSDILFWLLMIIPISVSMSVLFCRMSILFLRPPMVKRDYPLP